MTAIFNNIIQALGMVTCVGITYVIGTYIVDGINMCVAHIKSRYAIKHRFDKPPKAKCYCVDCKYYTTHGNCTEFRSMSVPDNGFCWQAEPVKHSNIKQRRW